MLVNNPNFKNRRGNDHAIFAKYLEYCKILMPALL